MKIKNIYLLIKNKKIELDQLAAQVIEKKESIKKLLEKKRSIVEAIESLQKQECDSIATIQHQITYIQVLEKDMKKIALEITYLEDELSLLQSKIKQCYGEKEGFEKTLHKIKKRKKAQEVLDEGKLAYESYIHKYLTR